MKINNEFFSAEKLGEKLFQKINQGYDITVEIFDILGNGRIILEHDDHTTKYIGFRKITPHDEVVIEKYNLGVIVRDY